MIIIKSQREIELMRTAGRIVALTLEEIEKHIKDAKNKVSRKKTRSRKIDRNISIIEDELKDIFGTKVNIVLGAKKGKIEIEYYSKEELDRLIDLLLNLKK